MRNKELNTKIFCHMFDQPSIEETFSHECEFFEQGYDFVIGIDEAGRGPLAGPVVACACAVASQNSVLGNPKTEFWEAIRDSKTLSEKQRESLYGFILENFYVGVGICDHTTIDRINVLEATYLAMKKAIASLNSKLKISNSKKIILVDGNKIIPNLSMEQKAIIGGDKFVKSISAASIVAKVTRDRIMRDAHQKYPEYGFLKHKGYGTKMHLEAIREHGICEIHRKSFEPIKSWTKG